MTPIERARLRQVIADALRAAADALPESAIDGCLRRIDARLAMAKLSAPRSNRARGAVRSLTQRRAALVDRVQRQHDAIARAHADADAARQQLVAGAPADLADAVHAARRRLDDALWHEQAVPAGAPLATRVQAQEQLRLARRQHDQAMQTALAWDG